MNQTETYGLSQWEGEDRILREDFNADNAKIEAALANVAAAGVKVITGSFSGTGTTGARTYNLGCRPKLVMVTTTYTHATVPYISGAVISDICSIVFNSGFTAAMLHNNSNYTLTDTGFLINHAKTSDGLNASGATLHYWALC